MKYFILLISTLYLFQIQPDKVFIHKKATLLTKLNGKNLTTQDKSLLNAVFFGEKSGISRASKLQIQKLGLMHLLTPSGLHLSSFLLIIKFIPYIEILFLIVFFLAIMANGGFHSMERVILFRFIYKLGIKYKENFNLETCFVLTFFLSILIGHFQTNSLSFIYSFVFWGTIIIFRRNKFQVIIYLNISLYYVSAIMDQAVNPLSLVINPLATIIFTTLYPVIFLLSLITQYILDLSILTHYILAPINLLITKAELLSSFTFIQISIIQLLIISYFIQKKRFSFAVLILLLFIPSTGKNSLSRARPLPTQVVNLPSHFELLKISNGKYIFIDAKCRFDDLEISCKKKPSKYGGPKI